MNQFENIDLGFEVEGVCLQITVLPNTNTIAFRESANEPSRCH